MNEYINLYNIDGTIVDTFETRYLDVGLGDSQTIELLLKTEQGFATTGNTLIEFVGVSADRYTGSLNKVDFTNTVTIPTEITTEGIKVYVKVTVPVGFKIGVDESVKIKTNAIVRAVN